MIVQTTLTALLGCVLLATGCARTTPQTADAPPVPGDASLVMPLRAGQHAPAATLKDAQGNSVSLAKAYREKPTALIFYRGGWCPYCNTHLADVARAEPELAEMGFQVLAISPDRPARLQQANSEHDFGYTLLSDSDMTLSRAFGLAFEVDAQTYQQLQGYGIDLEDASGRDHHLLPVPAVYLIDQDGVIGFAHWQSDYKKRLTAKELLDSAHAMSGKGDCGACCGGCAR